MEKKSIEQIIMEQLHYLRTPEFLIKATVRQIGVQGIKYAVGIILVSSGLYTHCGRKGYDEPVKIVIYEQNSCQEREVLLPYHK